MFKIERSFPEPSALEKERMKKHGIPGCDEVKDRLLEDSFEKCYICETKDRFMDVEHRLPHRNGKYPERVFDWNNLFLCCKYCNTIKNKGIYDDGIIDCCVTDPETVIDMELIEDELRIMPLVDDNSVRLTVQLLYDVHGTRRTRMLKHGSEWLRKRIRETMNILFQKLSDYYDNTADEDAYNTVLAMIDRSAEYSGFTRGYIRRNSQLYSEFANKCVV